MTDTNNTDGAALLPVTPDEYLIRKGGAYYRPNAAGYTYNVEEAGRYTLAEAIRHSHPNGPDGPRDGIDYMPAPARISHSLPGDVGEDEQPGDYLRNELLNIAAICEAKALHVEAASLRSTATVVSEQLRKWLGRFDETQEMLEHARTALQRIRERFANRGNSSPLWCDMAEDMEAYAAQGLDRSKARG